MDPVLWEQAHGFDPDVVQSLINRELEPMRTETLWGLFFYSLADNVGKIGEILEKIKKEQLSFPSAEGGLIETITQRVKDFPNLNPAEIHEAFTFAMLVNTNWNEEGKFHVNLKHKENPIIDLIYREMKHEKPGKNFYHLKNQMLTILANEELRARSMFGRLYTILYTIVKMSDM